MTTTTKLGLELLANAAANQILSNTTFARLNQLVQPAATDRLNTPPGSPADEALYIITATATGAWAGKENQLAYWLTSTGAWQYIAPREGMLVHVNDENIFYKYDGSAWASFSAGGTFTGGTLTSALNEAPATTLASASTVDVGAELANTVIISGTTTITSLGTIASGAVRRLEFQGILTLTHNGTSLILPTGANITTAAGDVAEFRSLGSGNWRCVAYTRANGQALATPGGGFTGGTLTSALNEAPITTIASSGSIDIGAATSNTVNISGTTTITSLGTIASGAKRELVFLAALTLTHNATSLILPGGANIVTAAGDSGVFVSLGSGNWQCLSYRRATGAALVGGTVDGAGFKNLIINSSFILNQREYVSGAATSGANQYTLDRWRVVTSGQNLAFSASGIGNQITAPAGGVEQVIEGSSIIGGNYVANWGGTATLTVNGTARTKGEVFTLTANTNATVRLIGGTATEFQLESGLVPTQFEALPRSIIQILCKRYYYRWGHDSSVGTGPRGFGWSSSAAYEGLTFQHSVEMRAAPTATKVGTWDVTNCGQPSVSQATRQSFNIFVQVTATGAFDYYPGGTGRYLEFNAEL